MGFVGTAKNTGKTTALSATMTEAQARGHTLAITSIGYDGEDADLLTGLPKPRIVAPDGAYVVTAEQCAYASASQLRVLAKVDCFTPLGQVIVCQAMESGRVALAGPNSKRDLRKALNLLREFEPSLVLVDGAFSRVSPMSEVDAIVLSTGAARSTNFHVIRREALSIEYITSISSALSSSSATFVGGVITPEMIDSWSNVDILIDSAVSLLANHSVTDSAEALCHAYGRGVRVVVRHALPLVAVTINPVYPFEPVRGEHQYRAVDASALRESLSTLSAPVVDAVYDGPSLIMDSVEDLCATVTKG